MGTMRFLAFALLTLYLSAGSSQAQTALDLSGANGGSVKLGYDYRSCEAGVEGAMRCSGYIPNATNWDGTTTYLSSSSISGLSDGKKGTFSVWFKTDDYTTDHYVFEAQSSRFYINFNDNNGRMHFAGRDSTGTSMLYAMTDDNSIVQGQWHHLMASWDTSEGADASTCTTCHIYLDGVDQTGNGFVTYSDAADINYVRAAYRVGAQVSGANLWQGGIADLWIDFDTNIDLSVASNREKFIDASGNPVYLGLDGSLPTGSAPDIFLSGATDDWHTNKGAGGGFTENGALTTAGYPPGDDGHNKNGLIGWWRLDETSGTTAEDSSGYGNDGAMSGGLSGAQSETAKVGTGLSLSGGNYEIEIPNSTSLQPASEVTLSVWAKSDWSTGGQVLIAKQVGTGSTDWRNSYTLLVSSPNLQGYAGHGGNMQGISYDFSPETDRWYHFAYTYSDSANTHKLFIDGVEVNSGSNSASLGYNTSPVTLGFDYEDEALTQNLYHFGGVMDDVRIYNRALSPTEIAELYSGGCPGGSPKYIQACTSDDTLTNGLISHWKFDEETGSATAYDSMTGITGTVEPSTTLTSATGVIRGAVDVQDLYYIDAGSDDVYSLDESWSLSVWAKTTNVGDGQQIVMKNSFPNRTYHLLFETAGTIMFGYDAPSGFAGRRTTGTFDNDQWHHIIATFDDTTNSLAIYVDGVAVAQSSFGAGSGEEPNTLSGGTLRLLAHAGAGDGFYGLVDDFRIYNRVITAEEALRHYQGAYSWKNWGE
ncbi:LamG domain-containing protein [Salipiger abyssi]|uniref:LamG domain-containing protein n=1 Tax=Salipiger abyssi TaxID=1250539 RepID=UPI001A8C9E55|nr:LamG-like jellyroll fold domain-containing protein [Salipiger abyssi]MBN9889376.1 hypothetical protein [Salipiger abyssi]